MVLFLKRLLPNPVVRRRSSRLKDKTFFWNIYICIRIYFKNIYAYIIIIQPINRINRIETEVAARPTATTPASPAPQSGATCSHRPWLQAETPRPAAQPKSKVRIANVPGFRTPETKFRHFFVQGHIFMPGSGNNDNHMEPVIWLSIKFLATLTLRQPYSMNIPFQDSRFSMFTEVKILKVPLSLQKEFRSMLDIADIYSSVTKFSDVCDVKQSSTPMRNRGAPHFNK